MARLRRYNLTASQKQLVTECTTFMLDRYLPRIQNRLLLIIKGSDTLLEDEGVYGYTDYIDDDPEERVFEIKMHKGLKYRAFLETFLHEMVHVKQFAKGEMKHLMRMPDVLKWYRQRVDTTSVSYWDLPWEEEAHRLERSLASEFLKTHKHWSAKVYYGDWSKSDSSTNDGIERPADMGRVRSEQHVCRPSRRACGYVGAAGDVPDVVAPVRSACLEQADQVQSVDQYHAERREG